MITTKSYRRRGSDEELGGSKNKSSAVKVPGGEPIMAKSLDKQEIKEIIPNTSAKSPLGESSSSSHLPKNNKKVFSYFWQNLFKHRKVEKEKKNVNVVKVGSNSSLYENGRFYSSSSSESVNTILSTNSFSFVNPAGKRQRGKRIPIPLEDLSNSAVNPNLRKKVSTLTRLGIRMGLKSKYNLQSCESLQHLQYIDATNPRRTPLMGRSKLGSQSETSRDLTTVDPIAAAASQLTSQIQTFQSDQPGERIVEKTANGTIILHNRESEKTRMTPNESSIERIQEKDSNGRIAQQKQNIQEFKKDRIELIEPNGRIIEKDSRNEKIIPQPIETKNEPNERNCKIEGKSDIFTEKYKNNERIPMAQIQPNEPTSSIGMKQFPPSEKNEQVIIKPIRQSIRNEMYLNHEISPEEIIEKMNETGRMNENFREGASTLGQKKRKAPRAPPTNSTFSSSHPEGHRRCMSEGNSLEQPQQHSAESFKKLHSRVKRKAPIPPSESSFTPSSPRSPSTRRTDENSKIREIHQKQIENLQQQKNHQPNNLNVKSCPTGKSLSLFSYPHTLNPFNSDEEEEEIEQQPSSSTTTNYKSNYNNNHDNVPGSSSKFHHSHEIENDIEIVAIKPISRNVQLIVKTEDPNSDVRKTREAKIEGAHLEIKSSVNSENIKLRDFRSELKPGSVVKIIKEDDEEAQNLLNDLKEEERRRTENEASGISGPPVTQIQEQTLKTFECLLKASSTSKEQKDEEIKAQLIQLKNEAEKSPYYYLKNPFASSSKSSPSTVPTPSTSSASVPSTLNAQKPDEPTKDPISESPAPLIPIYEDFLVGKLNPKPWYKRSAFGKSKATTKTPTVKVLPKFSDLDKEATRIVEENRRRSAAERDYNETANDLVTMFSAFSNSQSPQNQNPFGESHDQSDPQAGNFPRPFSTFSQPTSYEFKKSEFKNSSTEVQNSETRKGESEIKKPVTEQERKIPNEANRPSSSKSKLTPSEVSLLVTNHLKQKGNSEIESLTTRSVPGSLSVAGASNGNTNEKLNGNSPSSSSNSQLVPLTKFPITGSFNDSTREMSKKLAIVQPQSPITEKPSMKETQASQFSPVTPISQLHPNSLISQISPISQNSQISPSSSYPVVKRKVEESLKSELLSESIWACPRCTLNNPKWRLLCDACYYRKDSEKSEANDQSTMQRLSSIFDQINAEFNHQRAEEFKNRETKAKEESKSQSDNKSEKDELGKPKIIPELYDNFLSQLPSKENLAKEEKLNGMKLENSEIDEAEEVNLAKLRQIRLAFFSKNNNTINSNKIVNEKQNNLTSSTPSSFNQVLDEDDDRKYENVEINEDIIEEITTVKNIIPDKNEDDEEDKRLDSLLQLQIHPQIKISDTGPRTWKPLHLTKFRPMLSSILESVDQNLKVLHRHQEQERRSLTGENVEPPVYENCTFENGNWTDTFMQFHNTMQNTFESLCSSAQADEYQTSNSSCSSTEDQTTTPTTTGMDQKSQTGNKNKEMRKMTREDYKKLGAIPKSFVEELSTSETFANVETPRSSSSSYKGSEAGSSQEKDLSETAMKLLRKLEWAIGEGDHRLASRLARDLALLRVNCDVKKPNEPFVIRVYVEDRFMQQGPFQVQVCSTMRVKELKSKIESDWGIPSTFQKWILGRKMAENDNEELYSFSISPDSMAFLYIVSPEEEMKSTLEKNKIEKSERKELKKESKFPNESNTTTTESLKSLEGKVDESKQILIKLQTHPNPSSSNKEKATRLGKKDQENPIKAIKSNEKNLNLEIKVPVQMIQESFRIKDDSTNEGTKTNPDTRIKSNIELKNPILIPDIGTQTQKINTKTSLTTSQIQNPTVLIEAKNRSQNVSQTKDIITTQKIIVSGPELGKKIEIIPSSNKPKAQITPVTKPSSITAYPNSQPNTGIILPTGLINTKVSKDIEPSIFELKSLSESESSVLFNKDVSIKKDPSSKSREHLQIQCKPIVPNIIRLKSLSPPPPSPPSSPKAGKVKLPSKDVKETLNKPSQIIVTQPKVFETPALKSNEIKPVRSLNKKENLKETLKESTKEKNTERETTSLCLIEPPKRKKKIPNIPVTKMDQATETEKILTVHTVTKQSKNEESPKIEPDEVYYDAEIYQPVEFVSDEIPPVNSPTPSVVSSSNSSLLSLAPSVSSIKEISTREISIKPNIPTGTLTDPEKLKDDYDGINRNSPITTPISLTKVEMEVQTDIVGSQFQSILISPMEDELNISESGNLNLLETIPRNDDKGGKEAEGAESVNISTCEEKVSNVETYIKMVQLMEKEDLIGNVEDFECPICFNVTLIGQGALLRECLHSFCKECLVFAIQYADEPIVKCPYMDSNYSCNSSLLEREIKALVPSEIFEKHLARSVKIAESKMLNTFHCKTNDCKGWCVFEDDVNYFNCPVCLKRNCLTCQAIHEGKNCQEFQRELAIASETDEDAKSSRLMLEKMIQRGEALDCPACHVVLLKKWGCDWVRCSYCKTEICWVTKGFRWGPQGKGDTTGGCKCGVNGIRCHPKCTYCH